MSTESPAERAPGALQDGVIAAVAAADGSALLPQLRLQQLCSPAFPVGAFAYSQGMEGAIDAGHVTDAASAQQWIAGVFQHGIVRTDLPYLKEGVSRWRAHAAGEEHPREELLALAELVLASRESAELRLEEQQLGSSLARVLAGLGIEVAAPFVGSDSASYVVLFALACQQWEVPLSSALAGFSMAWLENQISVASRAIPLGQQAAQGALLRLGQAVPAGVEAALAIELRDAGSSLPGLAMISCRHEQQYSRLFRS